MYRMQRADDTNVVKDGGGHMSSRKYKLFLSGKIKTAT